MGGPQIPSCSNCRHLAEGGVYTKECDTCIDISNWKTRRGAKAGAKRKPGAKKTGPKEFEDRGELKQIITLSFKANDIEIAGGYDCVKEWLTNQFYDIIK